MRPIPLEHVARDRDAVHLIGTVHDALLRRGGPHVLKWREVRDAERPEDMDRAEGHVAQHLRAGEFARRDLGA